MISPLGYKALWLMSLRESAVKATEVAGMVGISNPGRTSTNGIVGYLRQLKRHGLVDYRSGKWAVSERGRRWLEAAGDE